MAIEGKDLTRDLVKNFRRVPFMRLRYLSRFPSEEELVEFFNGLVITAGECKHQGQWDAMEEYLERWEADLMRRYAANMTFLDASTVPWTPLGKPLGQCRVALITTGGIYVEGQDAFEEANDVSYREIPRGTPQERIRVSHHGYDITGPQEDINCVLPLHRFEELEAEGVIGSLADVNYSFMGLIRDPSLLTGTPTEAAHKLKEAGVDAAFITST